jgi:hypothetical protein
MNTSIDHFLALLRVNEMESLQSVPNISVDQKFARQWSSDMPLECVVINELLVNLFATFLVGDSDLIQ